MNRVILINKTKAPSREELVTSERRSGELLFADFPELQWAGFVVPEGTGRRSANWIVPTQSYPAFKGFLETLDADGYEIALYTDGTTPSGGQCEVRVF